MPRKRPAFSERAFHAWLAGRFPGSRSVLPLGDDTAAVPLGGRLVALLTTDALSEGTHFLRDSPPRAVGQAAANASLSDIASKGGRPLALLLDLLLPASTPVAWAREVARGASEAARVAGAELVGGDTKPSASRSVVGTVFGVGRSDRLAPRSGARPGDRLVVTGDVGRGGWAARRIRSGRSPTTADLRAMLEIRPRTREGPVLARWAHAMLDSSDGLGESARLLADASGVRVVVDATQLPLAPGLRRTRRGPSQLAAAFYGGDYELVAALAPSDVARAVRALRRLGTPLTVVGEIQSGRGAWIAEGSGRRPMPPAGWQPFDTAA